MSAERMCQAEKTDQRSRGGSMCGGHGAPEPGEELTVGGRVQTGRRLEFEIFLFVCFKRFFINRQEYTAKLPIRPPI